jgi:hypothetical protein
MGLLRNFGVFYYCHFYVQELVAYASIAVKMLSIHVEIVMQKWVKINQECADSRNNSMIKKFHRMDLCGY